MPEIPFELLLKQVDDLTTDQRAQLLEKLRERRDTNGSQVMASRSLYDALQERGMIGSITDGPGDLGTNPGHMKGFGEDAIRSS